MPIETPDARPPMCCHRPMRLRRNRTRGNQFWGCATYPACTYTEEYDDPNDPRDYADPPEDRYDIDY